VLPSDAERFCNLIRGMGRTFGSEPDQLVLDVYWLALKGWSLAEFEQACAHLLSTAKFMPRPADFTELRNAGRMTAGEAFSRAMTIARQCSRHTASTSGDPNIDAAASACGGYFAMGMCETEKISFLERRFAEHFEAITNAEQTREAVPQIAAHGRPRVNGPQSIGQLLPGRA
jgi:hypothetical protein